MLGVISEIALAVQVRIIPQVLADIRFRAIRDIAVDLPCSQFMKISTAIKPGIRKRLFGISTGIGFHALQRRHQLIGIYRLVVTPAWQIN